MIKDLLPRYYEAFGTNPNYTVIRSIMIDGHETAWMKYEGINVNGRPYNGYQFYCECDFIEGKAWQIDTDGQAVGILVGGNNPDDCVYRLTACRLRQLELQREYLCKFKDKDGYMMDVFSLYEHIEEIIFDLIAKVKANEFIGENGNGAEFWGGYFYLQTLAEILELPMDQISEIADRLVEEKKIQLEGAVVQDYYEPPPEEWIEYFIIKENNKVGVAYLPAHGRMRQCWKLEIYDKNLPTEGIFHKKVAVRFCPLTHNPIFGPDTRDVAEAEEELRRLMGLPPKNSQN